MILVDDQPGAAAMREDEDELVETPEVMRRRLRLALRNAREAAGLTQRQAADELEFSVSKMIRIEQGAVRLTAVDLRALLNLYGVTDEDRVAELLNLARGSRRQQLWERYREVYSPEALSLFAHEPAAKKIESFEASLVPGLLQTPEYARALLESLGYSKSTVDIMVEVRVQRQRMLGRRIRPELHFILGETAVSRQVGDRQIMKRQLEQIKELGARQGIRIQIMPFTVGAHPHMGGAFTILEFDDLDDVLYQEDAHGERTVQEKPEVLSQFYEIFSKLEELALEPSDLADALDKIKAMRFEDTSDPLAARSTTDI